MDQQQVIIELSEGVAVITINRPHRRNAIDPATLRGLMTCLKQAEERHVSVVILTGAGRAAFSSGGDIKAYASMSSTELASNTELAQELLNRMQENDAPLIAAIEGYCLGGGLELALGCDMRIAGASARFGLPEVSVNALPSVAGYQLARFIGLGRAKEMVVFGRQATAQEALEWGLVAEVVEEGSALARAREIAQQLVERSNPVTVARAKAMVHFGATVSNRAGRYLSLLLDEAQTASDSFRTGVSRFGGKP